MTSLKSVWTGEQTAELKRLRIAGLSYEAAASALNAKFGTSRTRKACATHVFDLGHRSTIVARQMEWTPEQDELLKRLLPTLPHSKIAEAISKHFNVVCSRFASIGRAHRLGAPRKATRPPALPPEVLAKRAVDKRREKRWAADPTLANKYERLQQLAANRSLMLANGATRTSKEYRKHIPRQREMTKGELRAVLSQAVRNTAAMGIAA